MDLLPCILDVFFFFLKNCVDVGEKILCGGSIEFVSVRLAKDGQCLQSKKEKLKRILVFFTYEE